MYNLGFTLLEVLISITLFAIVISSVYGAYRATFRTVSGTEWQVEVAAAARVVLDRMSHDLTSLHVGEDGYLQGETGDVSGRRADTFSCLSAAHVVFQRSEQGGGLAVLTYAVEETESGLFNLYRSDISYLPGMENENRDGQGELLVKGLRELRISYVAADGSESDSWSSGVETVSDEDGKEQSIVLPVLIRLQIHFAESTESEEQTVFRTAVAMPKIPGNSSEES